MTRLHLTAASLLVVLILSACNSSTGALDPSAIVTPSNQPTVASQGDKASNIPESFAPAIVPPQNPASTAAQQPQQTVAVGKTRLQIAPIVGTSVEAATPLSKELQTRARQRGITLAGSTGQAPTHVLKGYFSVITEDKDTTVLYVWDVYDPAGNRLHRINGQQKAASTGTEGWPGVSAATMEAIADSTIDEFASWLSGNAG